MNTAQPSRKDMAEFFRLSLLAGLCEPSTAARWAESIVIADETPHIAFIELCIAGSQPVSKVQSLLIEVPGEATADLPMRMLLGHSARILAAHLLPPEQILLRLYHLDKGESFPDKVSYELIRLEDEYSLVRDGIHGTQAELTQHIASFLNEYESDAPTNGIGIG